MKKFATNIIPYAAGVLSLVGIVSAIVGVTLNHTLFLYGGIMCFWVGFWVLYAFTSMVAR